LKTIYSKVDFIETNIENNILINSNFNCGYFINRDRLHCILRSSTYGIETAYDPCSYPGVKCKYYYNNELNDNSKQTGQIDINDRMLRMSELNDFKKYTEISFMIFRTGSCLIVGNCSETILRHVYTFIKDLLHNEFSKIRVSNLGEQLKDKKEKVRKKTIVFTHGYYNEVYGT